MTNKEHIKDRDEQREESLLELPNSPLQPSTLLATAIILAALIISASMLYSGKQLAQKIAPATSLSVAAESQKGNSPLAPTPTPVAQPDSGPVKVSVDDDPVLGNKNAPLTLIEFSDYECPFCKRYFTDTFPEIKKNYVDTGKLKIVFRDYPLPFHNPLATTEAIAANCSREQGGDAIYFKYHDEIFNRTKSNGQGLVKDELYKIAADLKLNAGNFKSCLDSEKYKDEIAKDTADGATAGVSGTPTVFIGKSSADGAITATKVVGAQPYSSFKSIIDQALSQ